MMTGRNTTCAITLGTVLLAAAVVFGQPPALETIYPAGGSAGSSVPIEISGRLNGLKGLHSSIPGFQFTAKDATHGEITLPVGTPPGLYDVWAVSEQGVSTPRTFVVSQRPEVMEAAANDTPATAMIVPLNAVINGRIEQPGDLDHYQFEARQGQRVIVDCRAERIDSRLRAVLELFDANGRRLAVNRGYYGTDPMIDFRVPADGTYVVKLHDLIFSGGGEHYYRLEIDAGPRVAFTVPNVVPRGQASRVKLFGWNLSPSTTAATTAEGQTVAVQRAADAGHDLDQIEVEIPAVLAQETWPLPVRLLPAQVALAGFAYHFPGSSESVVIGVTDGPVLLDGDANHTPQSAGLIPIPCDVSGRLVAGEERDWFAFDAQRGEVFHFDVLSQRLGAPTDVQLSVWNAAGETLLAEWNDDVKNHGGVALPTSHLDPSGRWVAPANGRYLILLRNLNGGVSSDPRRFYRLSVRREEPDFQLVAIPNSAAPTSFNVKKGGRFAFDVVAFRRCGMNDAIRISAGELPLGIECPEIVLGPGVDRGTMTVSAEPSVAEQFLALNLAGHAESVGTRPVRGGTVIRAGTPNGWSRLTSEIPLAVAGESPVRVTATIQDQLDHHLYGKLKLRYFPGSVIDVAVRMEQRQASHQPAVKLTGVGLPSGIPNQTEVIPAGQSNGVISFLLPPNLAVGHYSFAISGETTLPTKDGKTENVTVITNPVTFSVEAAALEVEADPFTPRRVQRGETFQVKYTVERKNGFIGKIHTELASPGVVTNVPGLRGRGVTFVGQVEEGSIQVVVNDDAPLGPLPFLRLFAVGTVEDQPTFYGAAWLPLDIME